VWAQQFHFSFQKGHYDYDYKRASLADLEYYRLEGEKISSESAVAIYDLLRAYKLKVLYRIISLVIPASAETLNEF